MFHRVFAGTESQTFAFFLRQVLRILSEISADLRREREEAAQTTSSDVAVHFLNGSLDMFAPRD